MMKLENLILWDLFKKTILQGRELLRKNVDRLVQFSWRPRPPVKLSEQKLKEVKKNLKTISNRFKREDDEEKNKASQEVIEKRRYVCHHQILLDTSTCFFFYQTAEMNAFVPQKK